MLLGAHSHNEILFVCVDAHTGNKHTAPRCIFWPPMCAAEPSVYKIYGKLLYMRAREIQCCESRRCAIIKRFYNPCLNLSRRWWITFDSYLILSIICIVCAGLDFMALEKPFLRSFSSVQFYGPRARWCNFLFFFSAMAYKPFPRVPVKEGAPHKIDYPRSLSLTISKLYYKKWSILELTVFSALSLIMLKRLHLTSWQI